MRPAGALCIPYTHRVAIANKRILGVEAGKVRFRYKDYADHNRKKIMSLTVNEFIRRFLMHVLPPGFHKIRYYGILATRNRATKLAIVTPNFRTTV